MANTLYHKVTLVKSENLPANSTTASGCGACVTGAWDVLGPQRLRACREMLDFARVAVRPEVPPAEDVSRPGGIKTRSNSAAGKCSRFEDYSPVDFDFDRNAVFAQRYQVWFDAQPRSRRQM